MGKHLIFSSIAALFLTAAFTGCDNDSFGETCCDNKANTTAQTEETTESVTVSGMSRLGAYETSMEAGSEIAAFDSTSQRIFVTNGEENQLDILDASTPATIAKVTSVSLAEYGTGVNSVDVKNGMVAVAVQNGDDTVGSKQSKGSVVFFDTNGNYQKTVEVGYLPDMVTFNEDGTKVVVANEGEPNGAYTVDPIGSIGIVTIADGSYLDLDFTTIALTDATDGTPVRLGATPSNDQAKDIEPEYITVSGNYAYVTLQENNAIAKVNLTTNAIELVKSLGAKSYETDNTIDIQENGEIEMKNFTGLFGLYQPDSIASYTVNGSTYLVTANEGDGREYLYDDENGEEQESFVDEAKIKKLTLDESIASAYENDNDLKVMTDLGDTDGDGDYDKLYTYGGRSFSIWDAEGDLVWDSGDAISKKVAELQPALFNQDEGEMDGRSGNKGAEPEALTVGTIGDKTYAFVGLERQNAIIIYDITNPTAPSYVNYIITEENGDISPEGMKFIPASESPNGKNLLLVAFEVSGSTVVYEIN